LASAAGYSQPEALQPQLSLRLCAQECKPLDVGRVRHKQILPLPPRKRHKSKYYSLLHFAVSWLAQSSELQWSSQRCSSHRAKPHPQRQEVPDTNGIFLFVNAHSKVYLCCFLTYSPLWWSVAASRNVFPSRKTESNTFTFQFTTIWIQGWCFVFYV